MSTSTDLEMQYLTNAYGPGSLNDLRKRFYENPPSGGGGVSDTFVNVALEDSVESAAAKLTAAGGGVLYFPVGSYGLDRTIEITTPCRIVGEGATSSAIFATQSFSGEDLFRIYKPGTSITGFELLGVRMADGPRHNLWINEVRTFLLSNAVMHDATLDGVFIESSWNGVLDNVQGWRNGRDGIGHALTAHAMTLSSVHAAENGRHGINVPSISVVIKPVLEMNGTTGLNIEGRNAVSVYGGYFEDHTTIAEDTHNHVKVLGSRGVALRDVPALQWGPGDAVVVASSDEVIIDGLKGSHPVNVTNGGDYQWSAISQMNRGLVVTADCTNVELKGVTPTPIFVATAAREPDRFDGKFRANALGADGAFAADANTDGLSDGWTKGGTPTLSRPLIGGVQYQRLVTTAGFNMITHPITLKSNTKYTVGALIANNGFAYFCSESGGVRLSDMDIAAIDKPRLVAYSFTTGATAPTGVGVVVRETGKTLDIAQFKVVEGEFNASTFPRFGQYEPQWS